MVMSAVNFSLSIKKEKINQRIDYSLQEFKKSLFEYIDNFRNIVRTYGSLKMPAPNGFEKLFQN